MFSTRMSDESTSGSKISSSSTASRTSLVLPIVCVLSMADQAADCLSPIRKSTRPARGGKSDGGCRAIAARYNHHVQGTRWPAIAADDGWVAHAFVRHRARGDEL